MRVSDAQPQVRVLPGESSGALGIRSGELGNLIHPVGEVVEQGELCLHTRPRQKQVIDLGHNERRYDQGAGFSI